MTITAPARRTGLGAWLAPATSRLSDPRLRSPMLVVGGTIVAILAVVAILAPAIAPYNPKSVSGASFLAPSVHHLLGTNDIGEDLFSQLIYGGRTSLEVGLGAAAVAMVLAILVGVAAGLVGGAVDLVAMRAVDFFLAIPTLPLIIVIAALAGANTLVVIATLGFLGFPEPARVLRGQTLSLRRRGWIGAAKGFGGGPLYVVRRHLVPGLGPIVVANFVNWAGTALVLEAALALFGLSDPFQVSWGSTMNRAYQHAGVFFSALWTWWLLPPVLAIFAAVLGFGLLGVGLEPIFNPRSKRSGA